MAATTVLSIVTDVRATNLNETTAAFWTNAELAAIVSNGARDLWRTIVDLYEHHFFTLDITNVGAAASTNVLTGVPTDVYRVVSIEPRVLGSTNPNPGLIFKPRRWNHPDFVAARAEGPCEARNRCVYYTPTAQGAPIDSPVIRFAPKLSTAILLTLGYNYTLPVIDINSSNPIPGESDNALKAWLTAYAKAKERDDGTPDPDWLAIYATEKMNLKIQIAERQIQEPEVVEGMFEYGDG